MFVRRVEEILAAQDSLLRCPEDVEREAGRLAERLLELAGAGDDLQTVRVTALRQSRPRGVGVGRSLRHAALDLILARMARPASEPATHALLRDASGAGELLGTDFESVSLMPLRRASDVLVKHRKLLERQTDRPIAFPPYGVPQRSARAASIASNSNSKPESVATFGLMR